MIRELWQIMDTLDDKPEDLGKPYFSQNRYYNEIPLSSDNFHSIKTIGSDRKICCVDGGNNRIYESPSDSIHLLRLYFNIFKGKKRVENIDPQSVYLSSKYEEDSIICKVYPINDSIPIEKKAYKLKTEEVGEGGLSNAGHTVRKYLEWRVLSHVVKNFLDEGDIIVRDGVLQTGVEEERKYAEKAYKSVLENGVYLLGLAKTCSLCTTTGYPLIASIKFLARKNNLKRWYYHPIAENNHPDHKGEMYVVKYHPSSEYAFRTEIYREQDPPIDDIIGHLALQANDPIFLGYPYGLVEADKKARVTDEEIKYLRNMGDNKMSEVLRDKTNSMNAHDRLSNI